MEHNLAPMPHWQKSLLFLTLLGFCSAQNTYYVKPKPDYPCPGDIDPCYTLSEYADNNDFQNLTLNATLCFLPGNHTLEQTITVTNLMSLSLHGNSSYREVASRIICTQPAGFVFTGIAELYISTLAFISCGHNDSAAVNITLVEQADISGCIFQNNVNYNHSDLKNESLGGAMYAQNSNLTLTKNVYQNNTAVYGGALYLLNSTLSLMDNLLLNNSAVSNGGALYVLNSTLIFTGNTYQKNTAIRHGGALLLANSTIMLAGNSTFQDNSADRGGALYVYYSTITLAGNSTFLGNSANSAGGGLNVFQSNLSLTGNNIFRNNAATDLGGALFVYAGIMNFSNTDFSGSSAEFGGAIFLSNSNIRMLETNTIKKNKATYGGGMYISNTSISGTAIFSSNSATEAGGGMYASGSTFDIRNTNFIKNSAIDGGGLLLSSNSKLYLQPNTQVSFLNNHAVRNGGAIKIEEQDPITFCTDNQLLDEECFFQIRAEKWYSSLNITVYFDNNTAEAGFDLHGGSVDTCKLSISDNSSGVFDYITTKKLDTFSRPLYICTCNSSQTNCTSSYHSQPVYPGGTLQIPVTAHDHGSGTVSANIQVINTNMTILEIENIQRTSATLSCTTLNYTIQSSATNLIQEMSLYVQGLCPSAGAKSKSNTLRVLVVIRDCPPGFQLLENQTICLCDERLQQFTNTCLINNKTVLRAQNAEFWVGYDNESQGLILHPHCPFDYCTSQKTYLAVTDSDRQCNYNRTELLCGRCGKNLSLALGSSRCLQCSNSHLVLLAAFAFAGIVLVLLLFVLRLTVAAGTINGLIFYANIVTVNSSIFLQPRKTNVLTVFIAWLNLDLGIETCFYDGMDALMKMWLQFAFPLYVWALVGMIILGSHYSKRISKLFGSNPIAVLATLFLLSYAKLLHTVIAALSYTSLKYNNLQVSVWLYDGNIQYLSHKHIPLFVFAIACLLLLFFPYAMLLTFGQWLHVTLEWKVISWISRKTKPFLDAYHAPYTGKHRYWTGLMLLLRFLLFLVSIFNALGDTTINLLAIMTTTVAILTLIALFRNNIYKNRYLSLLEILFILNLAVLTIASYHVRFTGGNQNAATFTSVSIAFTTFTGIVIYHSYQQTKGTWLWRKVCQRRRGYVYIQVPHSDDDDSGRQSPPDLVHVSIPTQSEVSMEYNELREPCLESD